MIELLYYASLRMRKRGIQYSLLMSVCVCMCLCFTSFFFLTCLLIALESGVAIAILRIDHHSVQVNLHKKNLV